jgi:hypothetical protein
VHKRGARLWRRCDMGNRRHRANSSGTRGHSTVPSAPLTIVFTLRDGKRREFRIIPGMARTGFLLSPLIENRLSFALLASAVPAGETAEASLLREESVGAIAVQEPVGGVNRHLFRPNVRVSLARFIVTRQDIRAVPGYEFLVTLLELRRNVVHSDWPVELQITPFGRYILFAMASTQPRPTQRRDHAATCRLPHPRWCLEQWGANRRRPVSREHPDERPTSLRPLVSDARSRTCPGRPWDPKRRYRPHPRSVGPFIARDAAGPGGAVGLVLLGGRAAELTTGDAGQSS